MKFTAAPGYQHGQAAKIGVLLVNLGTPTAATAAAVRPYLKKFLSDPRVVEAPRLLWWFVLRLLVLTTRPRRTAAAYQKIWQPQGSPLQIISRRQQQGLEKKLTAQLGEDAVCVTLAMSYSAPSISEGLRTLRQTNCRYLLVLPLYPQYAGSTVGSVFNDMCAELSHWRWVPQLRFISGYADDPRYIAALAASIADYRKKHGDADKLIFSFHGTPLQMLTDGDPYHCMCHQTARLTAAKLGLAEDKWQVTFQSRFGKAVWLKPYTDETLAALPKQGIKNVQVVCPAFAADCLETLEEIAGENREVFINAGGSSYDYIPALNDDEAHLTFLCDLAMDAIGDWRQTLACNAEQRNAQQAAYQKVRTDYPDPLPTDNGCPR